MAGPYEFAKAAAAEAGFEYGEELVALVGNLQAQEAGGGMYGNQIHHHVNPCDHNACAPEYPQRWLIPVFLSVQVHSKQALNQPSQRD